MRFKLGAGLLMILALFMLGGCGGDEEKKDATGGNEAPAQEESAPAEEEKAGFESPKAMADAAFEIFMQGYDAVVAMADAPPSLEEAKGVLEPLKEELVAKLVAIGKEREAYDDSQKASYNSSLMSAMRKIDMAKATKFNEVVKHYRTEDNDFANLIASFNILTQYADFELLKEQAPDEAARLGIE